jgi:hypothetical protein
MSTYHIRARMLAHDVRLNLWIQTEAVLDHPPSQAEAERLLRPEAERALERSLCPDCPYELLDLQITRDKDV